MSNTVIALRQSGESSNTPSLGVLANGELALNFADGILYYKTSSNTLGSILTATPGGLSTEVQFNDAGSFGGDSGFTYNKTTGTITIGTAAIVSGMNVTSAVQSAFNQANTANSTDFTTVNVTPGTYGNTTSLLSVTVAANGRLTNVSTQTIDIATIGDVLAISIALG